MAEPHRQAADPLAGSVIRWLDEFAPQGILITDADLVIRGWNRWLEVNSGYPSAAVLGRPLLDAFPDLAARGLAPYFHAALVGEIKVVAQGFHRYLIAPVGRDVAGVRQSGRIAPLWSDGAIIGTVTVIEDVGERVAAERELRSQIEAAERAREAAEEAVRVKDEFLTTLSHEMRTPLNAVIGWTQILRSTGADEARTAHALDVIHRNATAQLRLIDDMLDTARIMSGKLRLEARPVDLARVALAAVDVVSPTAEAKRIALTVDLEAGAMPMLGDPDRLQQIVWNLLTNAIKFTPSGGSVALALGRVGNDLTLSVKDSGEGISAEFLPHLFERFQQGDPSSNRRHAGLGLGLSLVRQLVELHGGRIAVTTTVGEGSTFTVRFTAAEGPGDAPGRGPVAAAGPVEADALAAIRIVVVAADTSDRALVSAALEQHGAHITAVRPADDAWPILQGLELPQVIVASACDAHAGETLIEILNALSTGPGSSIPTLAVTPPLDAGARTRLLAAGYRQHLTTPLSPASVVAAILDLTRAH